MLQHTILITYKYKYKKHEILLAKKFFRFSISDLLNTNKKCQFNGLSIFDFSDHPHNLQDLFYFNF
jgi:hypothetical protein